MEEKSRDAKSLPLGVLGGGDAKNAAIAIFH